MLPFFNRPSLNRCTNSDRAFGPALQKAKRNSGIACKRNSTFACPVQVCLLQGRLTESKKSYPGQGFQASGQVVAKECSGCIQVAESSDVQDSNCQHCWTNHVGNLQQRSGHEVLALHRQALSFLESKFAIIQNPKACCSETPRLIRVKTSKTCIKILSMCDCALDCHVT